MLLITVVHIISHACHACSRRCQVAIISASSCGRNEFVISELFTDYFHHHDSISCAEEPITCVDGTFSEDWHSILTELFNSEKKNQESASELEKRLLELQHKFSDLKAVTHELRNELKIEKANALWALQASAIDKHNLGEAVRSNRTETSNFINEIPRSELYRIDEKFTGENRSLYPAFRRQISIALSQNADRYVTL